MPSHDAAWRGDGCDNLIAHSLRADGFDASEDGTGRGTPIVAVGRGGDVAATLQSAVGGNGNAGNGSEMIIAFDARQSNVIQYGNRAGPLDTDAFSQAVLTLAIRGRGDSHDLEYRADGTANAILTPNGGRAGIGVGAVAFAENVRSELREMDVTDALTKGGGKPGQGLSRHPPRLGTVRRLTPVECERLQGFPDGYTAIPYRGKPAADGPRYKALGNSMACNVMRWIGRRIAMVAAL